MGMVLTEEQQMLRDSAADFIAGRAPVSSLRSLRDTQDATGFSKDLWKEMAEMGWAGVHIPEEHGGLGFGFQGLGVVMEQAGRTLAASPLLSTVALGATAIMQGGSDAQKAAILPKIASGDLLLALAIDEGNHHEPNMVRTQAKSAGGGYTLSGSKRLVVDGHVADHLIVSARTAGTAGDVTGVTLFLVDAKAPGVTVKRTMMVDNRNAATVDFKDVSVGADAVLGTTGEGFALLDRVLDYGRVALASEMLGSAQAAFDITLDYLKQRTQFGVLIGQFQSLQHRAAIMFAELELLRATVLEAQTVLDEAQQGRMGTMASMAKTRANDTFHLVAREAVQMHGGIGMTDAHDIGFYLKRSAVAETLLGDSRFHRGRYATLSGY